MGVLSTMVDLGLPVGSSTREWTTSMMSSEPNRRREDVPGAVEGSTASLCEGCAE